MPIQILLIVFFTHVGKSEIILLLFTAVTVYLSHQRQRGHHFKCFEQYFENFWKKYNLALHLVEMDTDPDPPKLFRSDRIWIHHYIVHKPIHKDNSNFMSFRVFRLFILQLLRY